MNLIHRHILSNVALTCAAAVGLFGFVLMIGNALKDLLPLMVAGQIEFGQAVRLIAWLVPFVISYALPMGMLTGILLGLGRMSSDREITTLRVAGMGVAWLNVDGWFDNQPGLRPDLWMWLPNLTFQALGPCMIYRIDR